MHAHLEFSLIVQSVVKTTEDEAESRPTILHVADSVRMSPIDLHMTNEGLVNEDECVSVIDEAEYMCNHDESKDKTEF